MEMALKLNMENLAETNPEKPAGGDNKGAHTELGKHWGSSCPRLASMFMSSSKTLEFRVHVCVTGETMMLKKEIF